MSTINSVKGSDESDDSSQMLRRIDSLIDMWFTRSPPPYPPPSRPLPKLPNKAEKQREHSKQTVNKLLLRAHVALIYSSHEGATQALCYADRAFDLAVEHRIPKHRGKAQWLRGEALMRMERWEDAYGAFVSSARAVEGGWRKQGELGLVRGAARWCSFDSSLVNGAEADVASARCRSIRSPTGGPTLTTMAD